MHREDFLDSEKSEPEPVEKFFSWQLRNLLSRVLICALAWSLSFEVQMAALAVESI
jgi:hypothetical protein